MSEEITIPEEHNTHYKKVLEATKKSGNSTAEKRIPELYWILRNEEGKNPLDAKDQVKQDLIDTFSRVTMDKHFPDEAKDEEKQRAARIRWERKQQKDKEKSASSADAQTDSVGQTEQESETLPPITVAIGGTQEPEQSTYDPEQEIKKIGEIRRAEQKREAEEPIIPDDEDPKDLEIQFLKEKVAELEDALKKTEQFKPANKLTEEQARDMTMEVVAQAGLAVPLPNEESIFDWIKKRDNGVTCYWYDGYGIELFKTRILTQLKGKGVTTFKRLYFEV